MIKKKDDSEQRALIAILLSLVVFWSFNAYFAPPAPPPGQTPVAEAPAPGDTPGIAEPAVAPVAAPAPVSEVPERSLEVASAEVDAALRSRGGGLSEVVLPNHEAPYEVTPVWSRVMAMVNGEADGEWKPYGEAPGPERLISEEGVVVTAGAGALGVGDFMVEGQGPWTATRQTPEGLRVTQTWSTTADPRVFDVSVRYDNIGTQAYSGPLWVGSADHFSGEASRYDSVARPEGVADGDLENLLELSDAEEAPVNYTGPVSWFGIGDRYFLAAAIPDNPSWGELSFAQVDTNRYGAFMVKQAQLAPGGSETLGLQVYLGSKDLEILRAMGNDLPESVDLGFFGFFAGILLWFLQTLQGFVGNWGVAIILLTLAVKGLFWPLTRKSFVSGRKMQALSPKLNALRETYKDDPQAAGQAQMKLFQEEGVNPLSGCLPMVVQMPVWFALYSVLLYTSDVYHAEFLYLRDLSSIDPLGVLPAVVGVLMILQQRMTPMSPNMDPTQQKMMRLMPLIFVGFMFVFPSGLALYILVNTILSIVQMWLINRTIPIPVASAEPNAA